MMKSMMNAVVAICSFFGGAPAIEGDKRRKAKPVVEILEDRAVPAARLMTDLTMGISGPGSVQSGQSATYRLQVTNQSGKASSGIVSLAIPQGMTFVRAGSTGGWDQRGNVLTKNVGNIRAWTTKSLVVNVRTATTDINRSVTVTGRVRSYLPDRNMRNNVASMRTKLFAPTADVSMVLTGPDTAIVGDNIVYNAIVRNDGPSATTAQVSLTLPQGLRYEVSQGWEQLGYDVVRDVTLASGEQKSLSVSLVVGSDAADSEIVMAGSVLGSVFDPDPSNDFAEALTLIEAEEVGTDELFVTVLSTGTTDRAVKNEKNITLLAYEMYAPHGDVFNTGLVFRADTGSLLNGGRYHLWVDTDGSGAVDTILQYGALPASGQIRFDNMIGGGYVIPGGDTVRFEVHMDVSASLLGNSLQLAFATDTTSYVTAESWSDGSPLTGIRTNGSSPSTRNDIVVTTTPSKVWSFVNQGTLIVQQSTTPVSSRYLLEGTLSPTSVLNLSFRAEDESIEVTDLQFTTIAGMGTSVDRLELYKAGATTPFASATIGAAGSDQVPTSYNGRPAQTFVANMENQQLLIPEGQEVTIFVRPRLKSDDQGGVAGENVQFGILGLPGVPLSNAAGTGTVRARGVSSSNDLVANDGDGRLGEGEVIIGNSTGAANTDLIGSVNTATGALITSVTNANPDADNTNVPTGPSRPFAQFRMNTAVNSNSLNGLDRVRLEELTFTIDATNVLMSSNAFGLYNKADSGSKFKYYSLTTLDGQAITTTTVTGIFRITFAQLSSSYVHTDLNSGETNTFVVEGEVLNAKMSTGLQSVLQGTLETDTVKWMSDDARFGEPVFTGLRYPTATVKSTRYVS